MKKRGMLTMVLASAMAVSTLAAVPAAADETAASSLDIYGGLTPMEDADDPITYTIFVRDPGVAPSEDNPVIKKIQELTGVTLKFEYLVGDPSSRSIDIFYDRNSFRKNRLIQISPHNHTDTRMNIDIQKAVISC